MKKSLLAEPEYKDKDDIVTLILKNNVSKDEDTISEKTMKKIENIFDKLNYSQKQVLNFLIINKKATIEEIENRVKISTQMIRQYLNHLIFNEIIIRNSEKLRDKNAIYKLKK